MLTAIVFDPADRLRSFGLVAARARSRPTTRNVKGVRVWWDSNWMAIAQPVDYQTLT